MGFWKDLVLANSVKLVCNLVGSTGGWSGCSQYWPTRKGEPIEAINRDGQRIRVSLTAMSTLAPTLLRYILKVELLEESNEIVVQTS